MEKWLKTQHLKYGPYVYIYLIMVLYPKETNPYLHFHIIILGMSTLLYFVCVIYFVYILLGCGSCVNMLIAS